MTSPARRLEAEEAQNGGFARRSRRRSGDGFLREHGREQNEERGTGEEKEERGSHCPLLNRARSRGVDRGGSGVASAVFN